MDTLNQNLGDNKFTVAPHQFSLSFLEDPYPVKIKRKDYPQKGIYTLRNMMSPAECDRLVAKAESTGFQEAGLAYAQDLYRVKEKTRNNQRMIFEDQNFADTLYGRIQHLVDPKFANHYAHGLNWRFRVYKYVKGNAFTPHVDERMELPGEGGLQTFFTFMIYLNEKVSGGETTFFDRRRKGSKKLNVNRVIKPRIGMGLAFDHLLFHEGSVVTAGVKYVLRSDLVYSKVKMK